MMRFVPSRQARSSASWLWQAATGVLLVPLVALHIIAQHFVVKGGERNLERDGARQSSAARPDRKSVV